MAKYAILDIIENEEEIEAQKFDLPSAKKETQKVIDDILDKVYFTDDTKKVETGEVGDKVETE